MKLNLKWSFGNAKLKKLGTVAFGIPAFMSSDGFKTCPKAGACAGVCYARQGLYAFPNVKAAKEFNLKAIRDDMAGFVHKAHLDLGKIKQKTIRVHDSGDFFSQEYLNAWFYLANFLERKPFTLTRKAYTLILQNALQISGLFNQKVACLTPRLIMTNRIPKSL